mmetsp:Transcript_9325/g.24345  ORF Transcript_9325/g.24345 Transcript_9325/m.24345 type:complete len:131 (+) Transcript_9325:766-1158(+)
MTGETGSYRFMAPEVFRHEPYGRPVDVYSCSMILYYMLAGYPPWPDTDGVVAVREAAVEMARPEVPRHWDKSLAMLLRDMWADEPRSRPSFAAVIELLEKVHLDLLKYSFEDAINHRHVHDQAMGCCTVS